MIKKYKSFLESYKNIDMWNIIPKSIKELHDLFKLNNKKLYLVGGAVRDFINNEDPKDFDLCTDATPDEIITIVGNKYRTNQQGKAFGVIVIFTKDQPSGIEVATFREDIYDDKLGVTRNPNIKFSTIEKDVMRRDIPFNSMFYDLDKKEIIDLVGGIEDIKNKITRFVGDPDLRIIEDPLRILRILRFSCRYNFKIEETAKKSIAKNKERLSIIARERILEEFNKSFSQSKDFNNYINYITEFNMWNEIFPGSNINTDLIESHDFIVVMSNLFKNESIPGLEDRLVHEYRMSEETSREIVFLLNLLNFNPNDVLNVYKKKRDIGIKDSTILEWLKVNNIKDPLLYKFIDYRPTISAKELMDSGLKGKELGDKIKELETKKFKSINESKLNSDDEILQDVGDILLELKDIGFDIHHCNFRFRDIDIHSFWKCLDLKILKPCQWAPDKQFVYSEIVDTVERLIDYLDSHGFKISSCRYKTHQYQIHSQIVYQNRIEHDTPMIEFTIGFKKAEER